MTITWATNVTATMLGIAPDLVPGVITLALTMAKIMAFAFWSFE
jgi:hypothetical protein